MAKINILDFQVANMIAAGEVMRERLRRMWRSAGEVSVTSESRITAAA